MFRLQLETDNDAFLEDGQYEIARILREVADSVEGGAIQNYIRDLNGNRIGQFAQSIPE